MFILRRAALRAASSTTSIAAAASAKPRSFTSLSTSTCSSIFRSSGHQQWLAAQRRFQSDDATTNKSDETTAPSSADAEDQSAIASAVSAAAETSTEYASVAAGESEATEAATRQADSDSQTIAQTAAAAAGAVGGAAAAAAGETRDPQQRGQFVPLQETKQTLYVGNMFWQTTEDRLRQEFSAFGNIVRAFVMRDNMGRSKGYGFVEFESEDAAAQAIEQLNQRIVDGRRLSVQYHRRREAADSRHDRLTRPRRPGQPSKTLFIGNMSFEMTDRDLTDLFRDIRNVLDVRVAIDRRTGQPRGFAHADFIDETSAAKAMELLQNKEVYGRKLRIDYSASSSRSQDGFGRQQDGYGRQ